MSAKEQELMDLKENIEKAKREKSKEEGRLESLMERLKKEHDLDDLDSAAKKVESLDEEIKSLEDEFNKGYQDLKENYQWD